MKPALITSLGYRRVASVSPRTLLASVDANVNEIITWCERADEEGCEVIVFPELCITGYTIGDLVRLPDLLNAALRGLEKIRHWSTGRAPIIIVGLPIEIGSKLYNCAAVINDAHVKAIVPKTFLPSSREYYDNRWYVSGANTNVDTIKVGSADVPFGTDLLISDANDSSCLIGIELCEDVWSVEPPSGKMAQAGATLICNLSASNELIGKAPYRKSLIAHQSARTYTCYAYASAGPTESTTDAIFSGHCMIAESGEMLVESDRLQIDGTMVIADADLQRCVHERLNGTSFNQAQTDNSYRVITINVQRSIKKDVRRQLDANPFVPSATKDRAERCMEVIRLQATSLAVRVRHTQSQKLILGLSGGLDSTLAAIVCREACSIAGLTSDSITCISMPGFGTSERTRSNAALLAKAIGVEFREIDITKSVKQHFADIGHSENEMNVVFENAQARERTQVLMDIANASRGLVVGTGDLSEMALGWSTYNADHMSMYNVNSGVPKTLVRHLIEWYADNKADESTKAVLHDIVATPISPELLPLGSEGEIVHRTEELIGPYEVHDFFLFRLIRLQEPVRNAAILAVLVFQHKYTPAQITDWLGVFIKRFFDNQFKRSCTPDGVKVGSVALSPRADWRMPSDAKPDTWLMELRTIASEITN